MPFGAGRHRQLSWWVLGLCSGTASAAAPDAPLPPAAADPAEQSAPVESAPSEPAEAAPETKGILAWDRLTGNWFGLRDRLEQRGVALEASYTADVFVNTRGGLNTRNTDTYFGLFDLSLTLDAEGLGWWKGGAFLLDFQNMEGRSISERHSGDLLGINNDDAPRRSQLSEFWYEHSFRDGLLRIKVGKQDATADFATNDYGAEFVSGAAGAVANVPAPTYPDPAMGVAAFLQPVEWLSISAGVYDAQGSGTRGGFDTAFHAPDDAFTIVEVALRPVWRINGASLPGAYRVGGWHHSGDWETLPGQSHARHRSGAHRRNHGVYCSLDQLLYKEVKGDDADEQGLGAFFQFGGAPSAYNEIAQYYGFGLTYTGLIPGRDADVTGLAFYHANLSGRIQTAEGRHAESVVELMHAFRLTPWLTLKPDVQYIVNPGGDGHDAMALGLRLQFAF
ncbi:MAG: carbohydrate porin [Planctomycetes bacterium]|nr:carbohydrate porin [Planctomycetota bacterium]